MADFKQALGLLLAYEGGYENNANDAGGETVFGIARAFNPSWPGWSFVDELRRKIPNLVDLNKALESDPHVQAAIETFYRQRYWNFDAIPSQAVANKLLAMEVNFGEGSAIRIMQEGLVRLGLRVTVDGHLGPETLKAIQNAKEPDVMHALRAFSALYRVHRIQAQPTQMEFIEGWLWRDTE